MLRILKNGEFWHESDMMQAAETLLSKAGIIFEKTTFGFKFWGMEFESNGSVISTLVENYNDAKSMVKLLVDAGEDLYGLPVSQRSPIAIFYDPTKPDDGSGILATIDWWPVYGSQFRGRMVINVNAEVVCNGIDMVEFWKFPGIAY